MRVGSATPAAYRLGSTAVSALYLGATSVWTSAPPADETAPAIASFTVGTQASSGDVPITVGAITETGSPDNMTLGWVLTGTDQSAATPAQVRTAAEGGTALTDQLDFGTFAITTAGGTFNETLTAGIDDATSYVQAVVWDAAGNVSTVQADGPVDIDTTAPTLSGISTTPGDTTGALGWSTNTAEGTAYWILTTSITPPSLAAIIAGTGAVGSNFGSVAVSISGPQTAITATSLTNTTTYYFHIFHRDAVANDSAVSTDDVIPAAAASGVTISTLGDLSDTKVSDDNTAHAMGNVTIPASGAGQIVVRGGIFRAANSVPDLETVTIGGVTVPILSEGDDNRAAHFICNIPRGSLTAGSQAVVITPNSASGTLHAWCRVDWLPNADTPTTPTEDVAFQNADPSPISLNIATTADGAVLAVLAARGTSVTNVGAIDWTGVTETARDITAVSTERFGVETADATGTTTETRTVSVTNIVNSRGGAASAFFPVI